MTVVPAASSRRAAIHAPHATRAPAYDCPLIVSCAPNVTAAPWFPPDAAATPPSGRPSSAPEIHSSRDPALPDRDALHAWIRDAAIIRRRHPDRAVESRGV